MIDMRSPYSHLSQAISQDEEYWAEVVASVGNTAELSGGKPTPPPLTEWSQLHALVADLVSEVSALRVVTVAANSKKGAKAPEVTKVPRPVSALAKVLKAKRYENHYKLRDRVLPHLRKQPPEEPAAAETPKENQGSWSPRSIVRRR